MSFASSQGLPMCEMPTFSARLLPGAPTAGGLRSYGLPNFTTRRSLSIDTSVLILVLQSMNVSALLLRISVTLTHGISLPLDSFSVRTMLLFGNRSHHIREENSSMEKQKLVSGLTRNPKQKK